MLPETLDEADLGALLARLDVAVAPPSEELLARLQRAWSFAQPFHNLDLLAARLHGRGPLAPEAAVARCIAGLGGPCHVQSLGFLSLVRALGFDAHLCGATIGYPEDHLLVRVTVGDRSFYCDVGNGQPFLSPFPATEPLCQEHLGWVVTSRPDGQGILVERASQDQPEPRLVYRASSARRRWSDFEGVIARHHGEPGFGPFLTGLRVVRIGPTEMCTVRDNIVTRYVTGYFEREVMAPRDIVSFVSGDLGLQALPVEDAVRAFCQAKGWA